MATFRILGNKVLTQAAFAEAAAKLPRSGLEAGESVATHPLAAAFAGPGGLEAAPGAAAFTPIGIGLPLTILIREVYTGKYPSKGFLGGGGKPMAVVTGLRDYSTYAASSRAVNYLKKGVGQHSRFQAPSTFEDGTNVVAYSPAVVSESFYFSVEIAFDKFDGGLFETIAKGLGLAAGIPLLIPAQGYLLAGSALIKAGANWADALIDGKASFSINDQLNFDVPGSVPPVADFRVLCHFDASGMTYNPTKGLIGKDGNVYAGDDPYVVVSLDGAPRKSLADFAPTIATAGVLKQFFNMQDGADATVAAILDGLKLTSDMGFRKKAEDAKKDLAAAATDAEKTAAKIHLDAYNKNILNEVLRIT